MDILHWRSFWDCFETAVHIIRDTKTAGQIWPAPGLITVHMKALIDMSGPTNSLDSLQLFYDEIEIHTRPSLHLANLLVSMEQYWLQV